MAGIRQHFFPRFLQKGFASKETRKETYTWVYAVDKEPFEANIKNIGVGKYFYGTSEESTVDDLITERETGFSDFIHELRKETRDKNIDSEVPSELITHLIVRSQHTRGSLSDALKVLVDIFQKNLSGTEDFKKLVANVWVKNPELIEVPLRKEVVANFPPNTPNQLIDKVVDYRKNNILRSLDGKYEDGFLLFKQLFLKMRNEVLSVAKGAQIKALSKGVVPDRHLEKYKKLVWKLFVLPSGNFISGDIGPIGIYNHENLFQPFLFSKGEVVQVMLPISGSHIVVGGHERPVLKYDQNRINCEIASVSKYYFISSCNNQYFLELKSLIGSKCLNISDDELAKTRNDFKENLFGEL